MPSESPKHAKNKTWDGKTTEGSWRRWSYVWVDFKCKTRKRAPGNSLPAHVWTSGHLVPS
jgi:hypothetical protein